MAQNEGRFLSVATALLLTALFPALCGESFAQDHGSHPALREAPPPSTRPLAKGPHFFADPLRGDDDNDGTRAAPWKTIGYAVKQLRPGDTLVLRGGTYYENVYCALQGREDASITVRCYPNEQAVLDGGLREFFESPQQAWAPYEKGAEVEYRSARRHPNLRNVFASFGDSMVGLQTYYHAIDLRARDEVWKWADPSREGRSKTDCEPLYCGPGLWYDAASGYIHARLAHTNIPKVPNYRGVTDPRKVPIVLAPFTSVPLYIDGAKHVRIQDLVIRGAGYDAVVIRTSQDIELENVTVWAGYYGARVTGTKNLKLNRCGFYGNVAPWTFRSDTSKRDYPGRPHRNITRLNTHATLVVDAGREFSVYATPMNDDWEIAYCEFTDSHDGPYLGGVSMRFRHNLIHNTQDDGIYLSPMYYRHRFMGPARLEIYRNYIGKVLTAVAFGGPVTKNSDRVYFYRNVIDLREPIHAGRGAERKPEPRLSAGKFIGDHGSPPWSPMNIYHNTIVVGNPKDRHLFGVLSRPREGFKLDFLNNIVFTASGVPGFGRLKARPGFRFDGNLYWSPGTEPAKAAGHFERFRKSPAFEAGRKVYPAGFTTHSLVADPKFVHAELVSEAKNDYRLRKGSPAIDRGAAIPTEWPDPLRGKDEGKPDIGALPFGAEPLRVGRSAKPDR